MEGHQGEGEGEGADLPSPEEAAVVVEVEEACWCRDVCSRCSRDEASGWPIRCAVPSEGRLSFVRAVEVKCAVRDSRSNMTARC